MNVDEDELVFDIEATFDDAEVQHSRFDVVCKHWIRGLCKRNQMCDYKHVYDLTKMPECQFYRDYGECANEDCIFRHIDPDQKENICLWYARGFCKHGDRCRRKHIPQELCFNFWLGFCPHGPSCPYAHPSFETPIISNDEPGTGTGSTPGGGPAGPPPAHHRGGIVCHKCGQPGHKSFQCESAQAGGPARNVNPSFNSQGPSRQENGMMFRRDGSIVTCFKCNGLGHYANACPNRGFGRGAAPPAQGPPGVGGPAPPQSPGPGMGIGMGRGGPGMPGPFPPGQQPPPHGFPPGGPPPHFGRGGPGMGPPGMFPPQGPPPQFWGGPPPPHGTFPPNQQQQQFPPPYR